MATLPPGRLETLTFCETHWPVWLLNAAALSLTPAQVNALKAATEGNRTAFNNAESTRQTAKAATTTYHNTGETMRDQAAAIIRTVRAYAVQTNNPAVYALAQIPPPAAPSPVPLPEKPSNITITLEPGGAVRLRWKSRGAGGAFFTVQRRVGPSGPFVTTGNSQTKTFLDSTLPAGSINATYIITGIRGDRAGIPSDAVLVQFGVADGGGLAIQSVSGGKLRTAAA